MIFYPFDLSCGIPAVSGIYLITCGETGGAYVGSSQDVRKRVLAHVRLLRAGEHYNTKLGNFFGKYPESFSCAFLEEVPDLAALPLRESYWISFFNSYDSFRGFNLVLPEPRSFISEATREKMAAAKRGRKLSTETRARMSAAHTGKHFSEESIRKSAQARRGRKISEELRKHFSTVHRNISDETRRKMSVSASGRVVPEETRRKLSEALLEYHRTKRLQAERSSA